MPGAAYRSIRDPAAYEALRRHGYSKHSAAAISNANAARSTRWRRHRRRRKDRT